MTQDLRILNVFGNLRVGGAERRTLDIIRTAKRSSPSVRFYVATMTGESGELHDEYQREGVKVEVFRIRSPKFVWEFYSFLRREKINVVHSHIHLAGALPILVAWAARVPTRIFHARTEVPREMRARLLSASFPRAVRDLMARKLIRSCATVLAGVSQTATTAIFGEATDGSRGRVVLRNGVPVIERDEASRRSLRDSLLLELGASPAANLILHVGRADIPTKNREQAVRIFSDLAREDPRPILVFVGRDGASERAGQAHREALRALMEHEDTQKRVCFLGERDDVRDLFAAADRLLLTSSREGVPGVVMEALAEGCPVVASDIPGVRVLAESLPGLEVVNLEAPLDDWIAALRRCDSTPEQIRRGFSESEWTVDANRDRYLSVWRGAFNR